MKLPESAMVTYGALTAVELPALAEKLRLVGATMALVPPPFPLLNGKLRDATGTYTATQIMFACLGVAGLIFAFLLSRRIGVTAASWSRERTKRRNWREPKRPRNTARIPKVRSSTTSAFFCTFSPRQESLGFTLGVLVAGHYPLIDHARAAALLFNKRRYSKYHGMLAWACVDYLLVRDKHPDSGDHAAGWETSRMLALHPETVDLSLLPPKGEPLVGIMVENVPPQDATAAFGQRTLEEAVDVVMKEVKHRLAHQDLYRQHGGSLQEGLWRKEPGR